MVKRHYFFSCLYAILIIFIAGCDSTSNSNIDTNNLQLTITANPTSLQSGEYSSITATLQSLVPTTTTTTSGTSTSTTSTVPVVGYNVTMTITQNKSKSTLTIVNNITDASGNATAIYQAGTLSGIDIVQASISDGNTASVAIVVNPTPTPTPTATPTPSPTPSPTPTPTPTPTI